MLFLVEICNSYTLVLYYEIRSKGWTTEYCKINSRILPELEIGTEGCLVKSETKLGWATEYCKIISRILPELEFGTEGCLVKSETKW